MKEQFFSFEEALLRLCDSTMSLSHLELYALSGPSRAEAALFGERWAKVPVEHRRRVIQILVENAEANFEMDFNLLFRACLYDEDAEVRCRAIEGLWECDEATLVDPLVRMLRHDPATQVRAAAALALSRFALQAELEELDERRGKAVIDALWEAIHDAGEDIDVRRRAIEAISYVSLEEMREIIEGAYNDDDKRMRVSAVFAMGRSCDTSWNDTVLDELSASEPEMRYEAARAAGELRIRRAVPTLINLLDDVDREVQEAAIWALGQIGGPQARRVLEGCLQSDDEVLQEAAEDALAELTLGSVPLPLFSYEVQGEEGEHSEDDEELEDDEEAEDWDEPDYDEDEEEDWA